MSAHISQHINIYRLYILAAYLMFMCMCVDLNRVVYKYIYITTLALLGIEVIMQIFQAQFLAIVATFIYIF